MKTEVFKADWLDRLDASVDLRTRPKSDLVDTILLRARHLPSDDRELGHMEIQIRIVDGTARLTLRYVVQEENTCMTLPILVTKPLFGGSRYWFQCPAVGCRRRGISKALTLPRK